MSLHLRDEEGALLANFWTYQGDLVIELVDGDNAERAELEFTRSEISQIKDFLAVEFPEL